jgi:hypothetical protein
MEVRLLSWLGILSLQSRLNDYFLMTRSKLKLENYGILSYYGIEHPDYDICKVQLLSILQIQTANWPHIRSGRLKCCIPVPGVYWVPIPFHCMIVFHGSVTHVVSQAGSLDGSFTLLSIMLHGRTTTQARCLVELTLKVHWSLVVRKSCTLSLPPSSLVTEKPKPTYINKKNAKTSI